MASGRPRHAQPTVQVATEACEQGHQHVQDIPRELHDLASTLQNTAGTLQTAVYHICHLRDASSQLRSENGKLSTELSDLKERTASVVSKRAGRDQEKVEDVTYSSRPTKIQELYSQCKDGERMDAIDVLDEKFKGQNLDNARLVCEVFEIAFETATMAVNSVREHLPRILVTPTSLRTRHQGTTDSKGLVDFRFKYSTKPKGDSEKHLRDENVMNIMDSVSAYLRKTSDSVDTAAMERDVLAEVEARSKSEHHKLRINKLAHLKKFIPYFCKMAWQLVVQTPSMHIQYSVGRYDPVKQILANDPPINPSNVTSIIYLWPTLLYKLNGNVACKGIVMAFETEIR